MNPPNIDRIIEGSDAEAMAEVFAYYHSTLLQDHETLNYLFRQKLEHVETLQKLQIGFADGSLASNFPTKQGQLIRERLTQLGLFREDGQEHFRGSLVFPIQNSRGQIIEGYGKVVPGIQLYKGMPLELFLCDEPVGVFNLGGLIKNEELILADCCKDALTFCRWGFENVTCLFKPLELHTDLIDALQRHHIDRVMLAFRREESDFYINAIAMQLRRLGIDAFRMRFPAGKTVNEFTQHVENPQDQLAQAISQATWVDLGAKDIEHRHPLRHWKKRH